MKFKDIVSGMKLINVHNGAHLDKVGVVKQIIGAFFYVYGVDSGIEIGAGWSEPAEWEPFVKSRPMLAGDKRVNTRVVCVTSTCGKGNYRRSGIITDVDYSGHFTVTDDYGDTIGQAAWSKLTSFEVVLDSEIGSRPMNKSDIIPGLRVICTYSHSLGKIGTIDPLGCGEDSFYVLDDHGKRIASGWWGVENWRVLLDQPKDPIKLEPVAIAQPVAVIKEAITCPSYYLGERACTCGKHNKKMRFIFQ